MVLQRVHVVAERRDQAGKVTSNLESPYVIETVVEIVEKHVNHQCDLKATAETIEIIHR